MTKPALLLPPRMTPPSATSPAPATSSESTASPENAASEPDPEQETTQPEPGPDPNPRPDPRPDPDPEPTPGARPPRRAGAGPSDPDDADEAGDDADATADDEAHRGQDGPQDEARSLTPPQDWPWLERGDGNGVDKHPVDEDTGLVMYVGEDRALDYGTVVNLVNRFADALDKDGRTFPEAQKRLLLRRVRDEGGDDSFGLSLEAQLRIILTTLTDFGYDQAYAERRLAHALRNLGYPPPT